MPSTEVRVPTATCAPRWDISRILEMSPVNTALAINRRAAATLPAMAVPELPRWVACTTGTRCSRVTALTPVLAEPPAYGGLSDLTSDKNYLKSVSSLRARAQTAS